MSFFYRCLFKFKLLLLRSNNRWRIFDLICNHKDDVYLFSNSLEKGHKCCLCVIGLGQTHFWWPIFMEKNNVTSFMSNIHTHSHISVAYWWRRKKWKLFFYYLVNVWLKEEEEKKLPFFSGEKKIITHNYLVWHTYIIVMTSVHLFFIGYFHSHKYNSHSRSAR